MKRVNKKDFELAHLREEVLRLGGENAVLQAKIDRCQNWINNGEFNPEELRIELHCGKMHQLIITNLEPEIRHWQKYGFPELGIEKIVCNFIEIVSKARQK